MALSFSDLVAKKPSKQVVDISDLGEIEIQRLSHSQALEMGEDKSEGSFTKWVLIVLGEKPTKENVAKIEQALTTGQMIEILDAAQRYKDIAEAGKS
ncbi:MAG: hypothetical protein SVC26_02535 [Pseudomonadota bacterium]|nr:hypothetical protein [Pseudomonadota bacterium]